MLQKIRVKGGGARVITFVIMQDYDKSEKESITQKELKEIVKQIK
jgi:hypothetical protein